MSPTKKAYPANWTAIAKSIKSDARWRCEACGRLHNHDTTSGRTLTVHHLDGDTFNNDPSNLLAACQVCHLRAEHWLRCGEVVTREECIARLQAREHEERAQGALFS